ncbi:MAG: Uma2 family endonuclease [Planctomycetes bacterium]|nr:Uma2 family endonuclease [Planctomycetota bacterium]
MKQAILKSPDIEYPESDGKPMAETPIHRDNLIGLVHAFNRHFTGNPRVYVGANMFLYYEKGNPHAVCSPDVFVALGVSARDRDVFKTWEDGKAPDVVIELTSKSTKTEDTVTKKVLYAAMGVREYYLFDPHGEYLRPRLTGFRLEGGGYVEMGRRGSRLRSEMLGLELGVVGNWLRLFEPSTGEKLLIPSEEAEARAAAEAKARQEADGRRQEAEARAAAEAKARQEADGRRQEAEARQAAEAEARRLAQDLNSLREALKKRSQPGHP